MLKHVLISSLLVAAAPAFAQGYTGPLLRHISGGGFMPPRSFSTKVCEIYTDRVEITQRFGADKDHSVVTTTMQPTTTQNLTTVIAAAAKEDVETVIAPCDIPANDIYAFIGKDDGTATQVTLRSATGCDTIQTRKGDASFVLTRLVNALCHASVNE